jgi:GT2 family glycosyltransferase
MSAENINDHLPNGYREFIEQAVRKRVEGCLRPRARTPHHSVVFYEAAYEGSLRFEKPRREVADDLYRRYGDELRASANAAHRLRQRLRRLRRDLSYLLVYRLALSHWYRHRYLRRVPPVEESRARLAARESAADLDGVKKASVVMLVYNRLEYVRKTLASFFATVDYPRYELIVVDNGSTDGSADYLRHLAAEGLITKLILRGRNHGTSAGFNCGFAYAAPDTDFFVKLDSDIQILSRGWLWEMVRLFERHPRLGALSLDQVNHLVLRSLPAETLGGVKLKSWSHWAVGGACMTIPREVFEEIGYFNEDYTFSYMPDDIDYYIRLSKSGRGAFYVGHLISYHQNELDETAYRKLKREKKEAAGDSLRQQHAFYSDQDRGLKPLAVFYDKYRDRRFPEHTNVIELD